MKSYLLKALQSFTTNRCHHTTPTGRRCRQPACPSDPNFCFTHIPKPATDLTPDPTLDAQLTAELDDAAANLDTPANVLVLLSKIVIATNQRRLELRRARFLIAACNAILRAQRQILQLKKLESQIPDPNHESDFFDIPRPNYDFTTPDVRRDNNPPPPSAGAESTSPTNSSGPQADNANDKTAADTSTSPAYSAAPVTPAKPQPTHPPLNTGENLPPKPFDPRHFYPFDPSLPPGVQDPMNTVPPELRRRARYSALYLNRFGP